MIEKRRVIRSVAVLAVALAAGHLVQTLASGTADPVKVAVETIVAPQDVVTLAADAGAGLPKAGELPPVAPQAALPLAPKAASTVNAPALPPQSGNVETAAAAPKQGACPVSFEVFAEPSAMIGLTLIAPCRVNERVTLKHAGLSVSARTTATGALFTALPAMDTAGAVEVLFADGQTSSAKIAMPELAALRRFAVQWQADDAFQIHAFENGAGYGDPGEVSAANPHRPAPGVPASGGFLTLLGDPATDAPLLAEVYSFPADPAQSAEVVVEAEVTAKTCGRELLAQTISSVGGRAEVADLTLAMPDCDAVGDFLVLNNLAPSLTISAEN